ncbi:MAG: 50S ribosomal protein L7/L12 [Turneriella sp.]|nr:50S ribosomal protein L7/L12 [Leptospiraceae bacterium]MCX7632787.1 50S ribosomal protein L7/L12 [Turneriella sp.]
MSVVQELLEKIGSLTVVQAAELVKAMEEKFGISAAAPVAVAAVAAPAGAAAAPAAEEKTEFTVVLEAFTDDKKKIDAIKKVREITNLPLMDAKKLVESGNGVLKENVSKEEAEKIKKELEALGGKVALK